MNSLRKNCLKILLVLFFVLIFQFLYFGFATDVLAQDYSPYVWETPIVNPNPPQDLVNRLNAETQKMIDAGHLTPFFIQKNHFTPVGVRGGKFPDGSMIYWYHTGELLRTIGEAYPYLTDSLKTKAKAYINEEIAAKDPFDYIYPCCSLFENRVFRNPDPPQFLKDGDLNCWPYIPWLNDEATQGIILETLYDLWVYSYNTNDWSYITSNWQKLVDAYNSHKNRVDSYGALGGIIGFARIAQHLGKTSQANEAANIATNAMTNNSFNTFLATAIARYPDARSFPKQIGERIPVFFNLTPSAGRFLADHKKTEIASYLNFQWNLGCDFDAANQWCALPIQADFMWYITQVGVQADSGETNFNGPEIAWSVFLAQAYALQKSQAELRKYLDIPWAVGDLYFIDKLVATIEAPSAEEPTPSVTPGYKIGDINRDGSVDSQDAWIVFSNWGTANQGDVNQDGKVNGVDFGYVIRDWGR